MPGPLKWSTLEGRLSQPLTSTREALEQLAASVPLSPLGSAVLTRLRRQERSRGQLDAKTAVSERYVWSQTPVGP